MSSPPSARTTHLRSRAHAFCTAFTSNTPPTEMLDRFFTHCPTIIEHGPAWSQSRLPFLGRPFVDRRQRRQTQTQDNHSLPTTTTTTSPAASKPKPETEPNLESEPEPEPAHKRDKEEEDEEEDSSCDAYFSLLAQTLTFHPTDNTFPPADDIVVDADADGGKGVVSVVGKARFESVRTGRGWEEEFIWRLGGWDEEARVGRWEIWADPLSAWVAVGEKGEGEGGPGR